MKSNEIPRLILYHFRQNVLLVPLASFLLTVTGIQSLLRARKWLTVLAFLFSILAYPLASIYVIKIEDNHLRLWAGIPVIILGLFWILIGFFIDKVAESKRHKFLQPGRNGYPPRK